MRDVVAENFGLAIAFLCPGLLGLLGLSFFNEELAKGMKTAATADSTIGGFVFILVAAAGIGVFISNARYFVFDRGLMRLSFFGVPQPAPDTGVLRRSGERSAAWDTLRDQFYRYYQFSSNTAVALAFVFVARWVKEGHASDLSVACAFVVVEVVLIAGALDSIKKVPDAHESPCKRGAADPRADRMTNGEDVRKTPQPQPPTPQPGPGANRPGPPPSNPPQGPRPGR